MWGFTVRSGGSGGNWPSDFLLGDELVDIVLVDQDAVDRRECRTSSPLMSFMRLITPPVPMRAEARRYAPSDEFKIGMSQNVAY